MSQLAQQEQQHLDTINQMISGQLPAMGGGQQQQQQQAQPQGAGMPAALGNQGDAVLCEESAFHREVCVRHVQHRDIRVP